MKNPLRTVLEIQMEPPEPQAALSSSSPSSGATPAAESLARKDIKACLLCTLRLFQPINFI